jgi:hypothetical protein
MRIELPPASWADGMQHGDADAHTLTVSAPVAPQWVRCGGEAGDLPASLQVQVAQTDSAPLTLTF